MTITEDTLSHGWLPSSAFLRFDLQIPTASPSNNVIKNMHFTAYRKLREDFYWQIYASLKGVRPTAPLPKVFISIERKSAGELDWDNAYGGLKPILDCLVRPTARNPSGLGLIEDDSPRHMPYPPLLTQLKANRSQGMTRVLIFELPA